jgi:methyl acetate hydrolase
VGVDHRRPERALSGLNAIFKAPMLDDPGSRFICGINLDWLGQVISAASGMKLDEAIAHGVTGPLGMTETAFVMSDAQRATPSRFTCRARTARGRRARSTSCRSPNTGPAATGCIRRQRDHMKFQRMLLGNGTSPDGVKILESATVDAAFTNQLGDLDFPAELTTADPTATCDFAAGPGFKWGYGLLLNSEDIPGARRAGTSAWAGLLNTHFWVDRSTGLTAAIYGQTLPFVTGPALSLCQAFEGALCASL